MGWKHLEYGGRKSRTRTIVLNLIFHLRTILGRSCSVFGSNLKVKVAACSPYRYLDLSVYNGKGVCEAIGGLNILTNPQMIVEVLSPSTEAFDRGEQFTYHKSIESLTKYLLVATNRPHVMLFVKQNEKNGFNAR